MWLERSMKRCSGFCLERYTKDTENVTLCCTLLAEIGMLLCNMCLMLHYGLGPTLWPGKWHILTVFRVARSDPDEILTAVQCLLYLHEKNLSEH